ncbi:hypothetical protein GCM10010468_37040 [Actinocorallia longicatena]|uniref:Uncharacterized protein n=1 Tax=Actinocorallia longicatena TaxID=111803 RepID=A0ABP6QE50_9ACTN
MKVYDWRTIAYRRDRDARAADLSRGPVPDPPSFRTGTGLTARDGADQ